MYIQYQPKGLYTVLYILCLYKRHNKANEETKMIKTIQTTEQLIKSLNDCKTKSVLEDDLNVLQAQLMQVQRNIAIVKACVPEKEEEYIERIEKEVA